MSFVILTDSERKRRPSGTDKIGVMLILVAEY
jgi:hypothetical protein